MPKLRRLNGYEVIEIFKQFGFVVVRIKGSHHILRRVLEGQVQTLNIHVHGRTPLKTGMLHGIFRDACRYIAEDALKPHFYGN